MIKIAICDDERYMIDDIGIRIMDYFDDDKEKFELFEFSNGSDFLSFYNEEGMVDIVFMDIEIGDDNGIEIISKMRGVDENVIVIFVSSHESYVSDAFIVRAFQYINKPFTSEKFQSEIHRAFTTINKSKKILRIEQYGDDLFIDIKNVMFIESINKKIAIHMKDNNVYEVIRSLSSIYEELINYDFCRSHRSYIVNLSKVFSVNNKEVKLNNGSTVCVSDKYREAFKRKINSYINKVEV